MWQRTVVRYISGRIGSVLGAELVALEFVSELWLIFFLAALLNNRNHGVSIVHTFSHHNNS